jgi:hypothetical protein
MLRRFLLLAVSLLFFLCLLCVASSSLLFACPLSFADCTTLSFFLFSALAFAAISPAISVGLEPIVVEMEKHTMT